MLGVMTIPLWVLAIYILWTIAVVVMLLGARFKFLSAGGDPRAFGIPDDTQLVWRLFRTQANLVENLPLYGGAVLILSLRGITGGAVDALALIYIVFRIAQSVIHIFGLYPVLRLACLMVHLGCLVGLVILGVG